MTFASYHLVKETLTVRSLLCFFKGVVVLAEPSAACSQVNPQSHYNSSGYSGKWFLLIDADNCEFDTKVTYCAA